MISIRIVQRYELIWDIKRSSLGRLAEKRSRARYHLEQVGLGGANRTRGGLIGQGSRPTTSYHTNHISWHPSIAASDLSDLSDSSEIGTSATGTPESTRKGATQLAPGQGRSPKTSRDPASEGANAPEDQRETNRQYNNRPLRSHSHGLVRPQGSRNMGCLMTRRSSALRASTGG